MYVIQRESQSRQVEIVIAWKSSKSTSTLSFIPRRKEHTERHKQKARKNWKKTRWRNEVYYVTRYRNYGWINIPLLQSAGASVAWEKRMKETKNKSRQI